MTTVRSADVWHMSVPRSSATRPVQVHLSFDSADAHVILMSLQTSTGRTVTWHFGRDLLHAGTTRSAGEGDVTVQPAPGNSGLLLLTLRSPDGTSATFATPTAVATTFLARTFAAVPAGLEFAQVDLDAELAKILDEAGT